MRYVALLGLVLALGFGVLAYSQVQTLQTSAEGATTGPVQSIVQMATPSMVWIVVGVLGFGLIVAIVIGAFAVFQRR